MNDSGGPPSPGGGDDGDDDSFTNATYAITWDTNQLWLEITNVAGGIACLNLHHATNEIYGVWATTNLATPFANWQAVQDVWVTNGMTNVLPFTVNGLFEATEFYRAEDWTGSTTNGLPLWWLFENFGEFEHAASDQDSLGNTLGDDYANGTDPNVMQFDFSLPVAPVTSNYINSVISVYLGSPSRMAVLVNDTNMADAVWQPYSSNLVVNLSAGNGAYTVMVGLQGPLTGARPVWHARQVVSYSTPLVLTVTSPTNGMISQPIIQLQGLVNQNLSQLTYDISNSAGIFTNQMGYWQATFADPNLWLLTTNSFQCYDLQLTNGVNVITLHAQDLAGNTVTTNFNYTFTPTTNPPVMQLVWPQPGAMIGGSNFTLQATIDDNMATVTASVVDTNGDLTTLPAVIERGGNVWVDNLPLSAGTNVVTLTATNYAGFTSTTNFTVVQSGVSLTVDPISDDQLNQNTVNVTGTVGDPSQNVYVNGVLAGQDGDGNWEADGVVVSAVGAVNLNVQVTDVANNMVGANHVRQAQPAQVTLMSYQQHAHTANYAIRYCSDWSGPNTGDDVVNWTYLTGGAELRIRTGRDGDCDPGNENVFGSYAGGVNGYVATSWASATTSSHADEDTSYNWGPGGRDIEDSASYTQARVMIAPSGYATIGQTALYLVQAQVLDVDSGLQLAANAVQFVNQLAGSSAEDVTNDDGSVWTQAIVAGPTGAPVEVTPQADGYLNISFSQMKLSPAIIVYFSVDPSGMPVSYFNARAVESSLQTELSANVFDSPQTGKSVKVEIHVDASWKHSLGWIGGHVYVNRVDWTFVGAPAYRDKKGGIQIDPSSVDTWTSSLGANPTTQTWVNIFAHEGIWGNPGKNNDDNTTPDGDIASGTAKALAPYTVAPSSRSTIRSNFGF